jgi:hypothetical protein
LAWDDACHYWPSQEGRDKDAGEHCCGLVLVVLRWRSGSSRAKVVLLGVIGYDMLREKVRMAAL